MTSLSDRFYAQKAWQRIHADFVEGDCLHVGETAARESTQRVAGAISTKTRTPRS